ncbi:hypothetical protein LSH36_1738g00001 [Paralvinella palmiformis]|uniref:Uncharacterized protein n=1 Tax=Paralvinella palmiformis TaxID=53620 RepID=A0AAD9IRC6_9ANNE|nr:hypothetical protein LSH36_1738g00001 [Paralvinella palmiformis]
MIFNYIYNVIRILYWRYTGVHQQVIASLSILRFLHEKAKAAMGKDSQANSSISREKVRDALRNPVELPPGFMDVARAMSEEYGIPGPDVYQDKPFVYPTA